MSSIPVGLPFGRSEVSADVSEASFLGTFGPAAEPGEVDEPEVLRQALAHPIGTPRLRDLARPGRKVVLVTSDLTRPCPSDRLLPAVLQELGENVTDP